MMQQKKKSKIATIVLCCLLINTSLNAAIVSDNDGASFITKAEFDSAKNSFQTEINNYNSTIDDKISNALSAYISGAKQAKQTDIKQMSNYNTIRWMHGPYMYFTNRKFTAYGRQDSWTDTVGWQILKPENRRQADWDPYTWSWDYFRSSYDVICVAFMLNVAGNVTKQWGDNYYQGATADKNNYGSGPSIYLECEKIDGNWVLTNNTWILRGEQGYSNYLAPNRHDPSTFKNSWGWTSSNNLTNTNLSGTQRLIVTNKTTTGDIIGYMFENIPLTTGTTSTIESHIKLIDNPQFPPSVISNCLWETEYALKLGCGKNVSSSMRIDNGLIEDNRWKNMTQTYKDNENLRYSMFGADVDDSIKVNVAPKLQNSSVGQYIDLSESGNTTSYDVTMSSINLTNVVPWNTKSAHTSFVYSGPQNSTTFTMTIPLFYRLKYSELRNRVHRSLKGEYLTKGDGYPVLQDADKDGYLQLKIKYEERVDIDTSFVPAVTLDNKVKTYFKNKRFSDTTGTFYRGTKDLDGRGTTVSLNGTEWTGKEITVYMPVKKGEDVWMRIDPLTENGVFCVMTDIQAVYITE